MGAKQQFNKQEFIRDRAAVTDQLMADQYMGAMQNQMTSNANYFSASSVLNK